jgi:hypothetical protein
MPNSSSNDDVRRTGIEVQRIFYTFFVIGTVRAAVSRCQARLSRGKKHRRGLCRVVQLAAANCPWCRRCANDRFPGNAVFLGKKRTIPHDRRRAQCSPRCAVFAPVARTSHTPSVGDWLARSWTIRIRKKLGAIVEKAWFPRPAVWRCTTLRGNRRPLRHRLEGSILSFKKAGPGQWKSGDLPGPVICE